MKSAFNKYLYIGFVVLGFYQAIANQDYIQAASSLVIGMAFDPFNPNQTWKERPLWQKAALIIHLGLCAAFLGYEIGFDYRG
jgi:hypothetical protein